MYASWVLILTLLAAPAAAEDLDVHTQRRLGPERCLKLPPNEVATRCPGLGGRLFSVGDDRYALVERYEPHRATLFCDQQGSHWRCRRVALIDHDLRGASRRNPEAWITAGELLRLFSTAPSVKVGEELGALFAPAERRRSCIENRRHGCAVQAARLKMNGPNGSPFIKRRLWLVEDAEGPVLQCSDAHLTRCEQLDAAGWLALLITLRPSSQAPAQPPPELEVPRVRVDKRPLPKARALAAGEALDTSAGALDPYLKTKRPPPNLPKSPSREQATQLAHDLDERGHTCVATDHASVELTLTGDGNLLELAVDGAQKGAAHDCLLAAARRLALPRFSDSTWRMTALVRKR